MSNENELQIRQALEDIRVAFDFLFKRNFRVVSVLFWGPSRANWQVTLGGRKHLVDISGERGIINLAIGLLQPFKEPKYFDLEYLAQFIGSGRDFSYAPYGSQMSDAEQLQHISLFFEANFSAIMARAEREALPDVPPGETRGLHDNSPKHL